MAEQKIDLRRIRDSGACISDAFLFIRQHAAPLLKCIFAICAIFLLAQAIYTGFYYTHSVNLMASMLQRGNTNWLYPLRMISTEVIILSVLNWFTLVSLQVTLGVYIKYYLEKKEIPGIEEVWSLFRRYFLKICLYQIPLLIFIFIGSCFCLIPGIYLAVVLIPFSLVVMIEDKDFLPACRRCFEIITDNFWMSAGVYFLAYLIYVMGIMFIGIASSVAGKLIAYTTTAETTTFMDMATSFLSIFSFCFCIIFFIAVAMNYFSLVEKSDGVGLMARIEDIGSSASTFQDKEDQY